MKNKFTMPAGSSPRANAPSAFTLVELLIVISIIAILAALLMPAFSYVEKKSIIQVAQSERDQIETAIDRYHATYGFYPPGNAGASAANLLPALTNQLYYELIGTTNLIAPQNTPGYTPDYLTLDERLTNTGTSLQAIFGVSGIMNCSRASGSDEDSRPAQSFLPALKPGQLSVVTTTAGGNNVFGALCSGANADPTYAPLPANTTGTGRNANPWRYIYPGINNPKTYDLWLQIVVGGRTNLICNWKDTPQINASLP
jgi:prepilin-type N-terminal cleavage/methylation domain-containing protein